VGHVELPHAAARGGVIEHNTPHHRLRDAADAFHLNHMLEGVGATLGAQGAKGLISGIGSGEQGQSAGGKSNGGT
jgi:hypothetical protein